VSAGEAPLGPGAAAGVTPAVVRLLDDLRGRGGRRPRARGVDRRLRPRARGGLRAIAQREAVHAELLEERLRELGARCTAAVSEPVLDAALARYGSAAVSDEEKLVHFLARHPDDSAATGPIGDLIDALDDDPETRELLRLVADGERATLAWLRAYHAGLVARRAGPSAF
jgi:hypothetical protein